MPLGQSFLRHRLAICKYSPQPAQIREERSSSELAASLFEISFEAWLGLGRHLPVAHSSLQASSFSLKPPLLFSFFFFIVELFNTTSKGTPGCLVEIQSCHGNVACFSKLGHIPTPPLPLFFKMWSIFSLKQLLCFLESFSFFPSRMLI